jgi:peptidyl-prolyl cis-trans isomerase SurA
MNKIINVLLILAATQLYAQNRVKVDGVIAVVGKHIVLQSDIQRFKIEMEQSGESSDDIPDCQILEQMMQQKLLAHHAEVDSLVATEATVLPTVERKMDYFKSQLGGESQMLALYGFDNVDELREELIRIEIEQSLIGQMQQTITSEATVTPDEVRNYFNSLKTSDNLPEFPTEVKLAQIAMYIEPSDEEIQRVISELNVIKKDIENGANMKMKALVYSDDPGVTQNGGLYTVTRESQFIKEFKDAAFALDEGQVSEPFKSIFGYHIVKVEKVKGQELDVRHVLIQPEIDELEKVKVQTKMDSIRAEIAAQRLTFEEAVKQFSQDKETNKNRGLIINPFTQETTFKLSGEEFMRAFPNLHSRVFNLKEGDMTEVFYDEDREGTKMYKLVLMNKKIEGHQADFVKDYVKIQNLALAKKRQELVDKWILEKVDDTYIKISDDFKDCDFKVNFLKK